MTIVRYAKPNAITEIGGKSTLVEASAGTGKTYTIEHLVADEILERNTPIQRILVVTFTRKAAGELGARIRSRLQALRDLDKSTPGPSAWTIDDAARARLGTAIRDLELAQVSTIHSFCQAVLTEHAIAAGRVGATAESTNSSELFEESALEALRRRFTREPAFVEVLDVALEKWTIEEVVALLSDAHRQRAPTRPVIDRAKVLKTQAKLKTAVAAAAAKLDETIASTNAGNVSQKDSCATILTGLHDLAATQNPSYTLHLQMLKHAASRKKSRDKKEFKGLDFLRDTFAEANDEGRRFLAAVEAAHEALPSLEALVVATFLPAVQEIFERRLRSGAELDHDSLLGAVYRAIEEDASGDFVRRVRERYTVALVDEFQDTDPLQWKIFRRLFLESDAHRLYLVGDPKQSIYRFRGGDVFAYAEARDQIGRCVRLSTNRRSSDAMVRACNEVFATALNDEPFFGADSQIAHDDKVTADNPALAYGDPRDPSDHPLRLLRPTRQHSADGLRQELYANVASEIRALLAPSRKITWKASDKPAKALDANDVLCLTFKNTEAVELGEVLRQHGIPFALYREGGLFQTSEARDVLDVLLALERPHDAGRRRRAWLTGFFELPYADLDRTSELPSDHRLASALARWERLAADRQWTEFFRDLLDRSGLRYRCEFVEESGRALSNYLAVVDQLQSAVASGCRSLEDLTRQLKTWVDDESSTGDDTGLRPLPTSEPAVRVLTVHKAKGLEAPIVFLCGGFTTRQGTGTTNIYHEDNERLVWVGAPLSQVESVIEQEEEAERRRVLYVALTRARFRLYLTYSGEIPGVAEPFDLLSRNGLKGTYAHLHRTLEAIAANRPDFFAERTHLHQMTAPNLVAPSNTWVPGSIDLVIANAMKSRAAHALLRETRGGLGVTSYSKLHGQTTGAHSKRTDPSETEEQKAKRAAELPRGAGTGRLVHALLEDMPLDVLEGVRTQDAWRAHPKVAEVFDRYWARSWLSKTQRAHAERLVFEGLTRPVTLSGGSRVDGLGRTNGFHREIEFRLPIPEEAHARLGDPPGERPWTIERGFLKGFIDFAFEHDGRIHFGDWKTNSLDAFTPESVSADIAEKYRVQILIYTLALVRMAGIRTQADYDARFGGYAYVYLRGLADGAHGMEVGQTRWEELRHYERELMALTPEAVEGGEAAIAGLLTEEDDPDHDHDAHDEPEAA